MPAAVYEFRFVGSEEWIASPHMFPEVVAIHAMQLHGGRIGKGVVFRDGLWHPRVRKRGATPVEVRRIDRRKKKGIQMSTFPVFQDFEHVFCAFCKLQITQPFSASGHAVGRGAWKGQCTGQHGCQKITWFDLESEVKPKGGA